MFLKKTWDWQLTDDKPDHLWPTLQCPRQYCQVQGSKDHQLWMLRTRFLVADRGRNGLPSEIWVWCVFVCLPSPSWQSSGHSTCWGQARETSSGTPCAFPSPSETWWRCSTSARTLHHLSWSGSPGWQHGRILCCEWSCDHCHCQLWQGGEPWWGHWWHWALLHVTNVHTINVHHWLTRPKSKKAVTNTWLYAAPWTGQQSVLHQTPAAMPWWACAPANVRGM